MSDLALGGPPSIISAHVQQHILVIWLEREEQTEPLHGSVKSQVESKTKASAILIKKRVDTQLESRGTEVQMIPFGNHP